ncbi:MAG: hypothetical protein ACOC0N_11900 [Chroococcales cyanobacterium]
MTVTSILMLQEDSHYNDVRSLVGDGAFKGANAIRPTAPHEL